MTSFYMKYNTGLKWGNSGLLMNYNIPGIFWSAASGHPHSIHKTKRYFHEGRPLVKKQVFLNFTRCGVSILANTHHAINDITIVTPTRA